MKDNTSTKQIRDGKSTNVHPHFLQLRKIKSKVRTSLNSNWKLNFALNHSMHLTKWNINKWSYYMNHSMHLKKKKCELELNLYNHTVVFSWKFNHKKRKKKNQRIKRQSACRITSLYEQAQRSNRKSKEARDDGTIYILYTNIPLSPVYIGSPLRAPLMMLLYIGCLVVTTALAWAKAR